MKNEVREEAIAVFEKFPLAKKVFITPDTQAFLNEDRARMHNKDYETVKRSDVIEEKAEAADADVKKSAAELVEFIPTLETIAELETLEKGEKRPTVLAAIASRKSQLEKPKQD